MVLTVETELLFTDARANWPIALSRKIFFGFSFGFSFGSKIGSNPSLKSPPSFAFKIEISRSPTLRVGGRQTDWKFPKLPLPTKVGLKLPPFAHY